ncbi:IclR family transcriptional regulator [Frigidibacter sp. MR17.14]|uniref:IclR family transcriptional regulator n=1 Tax=Frigidibacter sp. MR17.14 TaxID=3126509 RepID=UPI003012A2EA
MSDLEDSPIGRALRIVEILAARTEGLSLTEIAAEAELGLTTVHRQLATLTGVDMVRKTNAKTYVVGDRVLRIAALLAQGEDVAALAGPVLAELVDRYGETAFLAKLDGSHVQLVATALPDQQGQAYAQPGRDMPLYAAASGKILLALQSEEFIDRYLTLKRHAFTPATKTDEAAIRADIERARARHIAVCDNEFDPGILSYATALRDPRTGQAYAIAIFGLGDRFGRVSAATVETSLINAAQKLSRLLKRP